MTTSGTVGQTVIQTNKVLEKAVRRCGLLPAVLTPEYVASSNESLFMLLLSLANRGLNLWCIEKSLMGMTVGQVTYDLPVGTLDVLNVLHATPSRLTGTDSSASTWYKTALTTANTVTRYGVKFSTLPTGSFQFQVSNDDTNWTTVQTVTEFPSAGVWGWYDVDPKISGIYFRVYSATLGVVEDLYLAENVREIVVSQFNRDDYANQPNKTFSSNMVTNFYFQKLIDPLITVWPVPSDDSRHLVVFRHRQVQDVGTLTEELEIPSRWIEAITWHLSARLAFELPGVEPTRRQEVVAMANTMTIEVEAGETDAAPIYFAPNIRGYTR